MSKVESGEDPTEGRSPETDWEFSRKSDFVSPEFERGQDRSEGVVVKNQTGLGRRSRETVLRDFREM